MSSSESSGLPSFEAIYKQYYPGVASTVRKFRFPESQAEDLIQDIFLQAWQSLSTLKDPKALTGWLMTVARNRCLSELKKKRPNISISATDSNEDASGNLEMILVADDDRASLHFEQSILLLQELIRVHEGEPRATIAKLFYLQHKSIKDICIELDMKQNTVLSHLRRFRLIVSKAMLQLVEEKNLEFTELL